MKKALGSAFSQKGDLKKHTESVHEGKKHANVTSGWLSCRSCNLLKIRVL